MIKCTRESGKKMEEECANESEIGGPFPLRNSNKSLMDLTTKEMCSMFPGFRFSPTEEELIQYFLEKKLHGCEESVKLIPVVDMCSHEPTDLPAQAVISSDNEWIFFSPREKKYPNGLQNKRATECGFWKSTGKERPVKSGPNVIGKKRTLVFHEGRAPKGIRTPWIVHEYCTIENPEMVVCRLQDNREFNLNHKNKKILISPDDGKQVSGMVEEGPSKIVIEPIDIGSNTSDVKMDNELSHHESSSFNKSHYEEDDCYADIMNDDIVELDNSMLSYQGTTNRRLGLSRQRL